VTRREPIRTVPDFPLDGSVKTLGWGVAAWIEAHLLQPDGEHAGDPFRLTREQLNFLLWWYAVDVTGRFTYRRAVLRRSKGWGKSPFLAALALAELCGPVRFGGWDEDGEPIGVEEPMPWVVVAGVSEAQTEFTMSAARAMAEDSDLVDLYGLDIGLTRILLPGGGKLLPITASSATQEGARPTFAILDETHWWTKTNGGAALAKVIRRNLAKRTGGTARSIETTNAHEPGQHTVAEESFDAYRAQRDGRASATDLLYDSVEAPGEIALDDEAALREALLGVYGDSTWVDLDRIVAEINDPNTSREEARRFYLNQVVAAADAWVAPHEVDRNRKADGTPLMPGDTLALGFDGSLTDDSTALVGVRVSDGAPFILGLWEKPEGPAGSGWQVDKEVVRGVVDNVFDVYDVVAMFSDVAEWDTDVDHWRAEYGERLLVKATMRHAVAWDMRQHQADTVRATEAVHRAIVDRELPLIPHRLDDGRDGLEALVRHIENARRRPNRYGIGFGKESRESPRKVDALAALILARMARERVLGEGALRHRHAKAGRLVGF
jgi:hypothetical protein